MFFSHIFDIDKRHWQKKEEKKRVGAVYLLATKLTDAQNEGQFTKLPVLQENVFPC